MATAGDGIYEAHTSLLNDDDDVVHNFVDFKGRRSVRSKSGRRRSASIIVVVEMAERFSYYGISSNMVSYLTGALGQSTAEAAANLNAWYGAASLTPILGAFVADSFLGRYRTVIFSSLLYILGLGLLTLSAALNSLNSSDCKIHANNPSCSQPLLQSVFFFFSFYLVALAQGGHKPCISAFGADQFDVEDRKELEAQNSFFNWFFWFACLGILFAFLVMNYIQENLSWELGFGIPAIVMCLALIAFLLGTTAYRFNQTISQQILPQEHAQFETTMEDSEAHSNGIKEAKAILKLVPIWLTSLGYSITFAQPSTLYTKQGATLDRHIFPNFELPAASLQLWIAISIMVFLPFYDRVLVPIIRTATKNPSGLSMLQRTGIGFCISLTSIVIAAIVESKRLATAREYGLVDMPQAMIPMSVWWLAPQYLLYGIADVFANVGLQHFFYDQVPGELKSIGIALELSILGVGSFLSSFLVFVVDKVSRGNDNGEDGWFSDNLNKAHLDYFYWLLAGISTFSLAFYIYFAKSYVYN